MKFDCSVDLSVKGLARTAFVECTVINLHRVLGIKTATGEVGHKPQCRRSKGFADNVVVNFMTATAEHADTGCTPDKFYRVPTENIVFIADISASARGP